jgi:hypothetical protein
MAKARSQLPRGPRRGSAAVRLLGLRVRILPLSWTPVSCDCCVLSGRGLCVQRTPTECGVCECDREASIMWRLWPTRGCGAMERRIAVVTFDEVLQ